MASLLCHRNHPNRARFIEHAKKDLAARKGRDSYQTNWPDVSRKLTEYDRSHREFVDQKLDAIKQLVPSIQKPINWEVIKANAQNPSLVDQVKAAFDKLQQEQTKFENADIDPEDAVIDGILGKPPSLKEQFDDLIQTAKFQKSLKYPELYLENLKFWTKKLGVEYRPVDIFNMHDKHKMVNYIFEIFSIYPYLLLHRDPTRKEPPNLYRMIEYRKGNTSFDDPDLLYHC